MKEFKGLWMTRDIFLIIKLSLIEKHILCEIISLSKDTGFCFASNGHFAEFFDVSKGRISQIIKKLRERKYIKTKEIKTHATHTEKRLIYPQIDAIDKADKREIKGIKNTKGVFNKLTGGIKDIKGGYLINSHLNNTVNNTEEQKDTPPISSFKFDLWGQIKQAVNKSFEIHSTEADNKHFKQIQYDIREVIKTAKKNRGETPQANDTECMNVINKVLTNWPEWAKDKTPSYFRYNLTDILAHIRKSKSNSSKQYKKL